MVPEIPDYQFHDAAPLWSSHYLWPVVRSILQVSVYFKPSRIRRGMRKRFDRQYAHRARI